MTSKNIFTLLLILSTYFIQGQQFCGTDEQHQELYKNNLGIHQKVLDNHKWLENFTENYIVENAFKKQSHVYTIPVVFHIIHVGGAENISDAQIYDQMRIINEDFQKRNADTANIIPQFQSFAADCELEFKLAKLDPNGNCTKGITRHFDSKTLVGDHAVKSIVHWDPTMYLNIYVCASAAGLAGHAIVPAAADTIPEWDGIVIQHSSVSDIGTGDPSRSVVLTHEIGHYLNLQHIWGGNNVPGYPYLPVADPGNCAYDDGVTDTPETIGWQTCNLNGTSCGTLDNIQNFMEYAYCPAMLTSGQKLRMHATLNSPIAGRDNLHSLTNLSLTGVNLANNFCEADLIFDDNYICAGESINFADVSFHNVTNRTWEFEGGTPSTSTDSSQAVIYSTPGRFQVKLYAGDGSNNDSLILDSLIVVYPTNNLANSIVEGFEVVTELNETQFRTVNWTANSGWGLLNTIGRNSSSSAFINHNNTVDGQISELISEPMDLTNISNLDLSFDFAYAKKDAGNQDKLYILTSADCGANWQVRKTLSASALNTASGIVTTDFNPVTDAEWNSTIVTTIGSNFWTNQFRIMFRYESKGGNNIYIDNINLFDPAHLSISENNNSFRIYPNPSSDLINLNCNTTGKLRYNIYNATGQLVKQGSILNNGNISVSDLSYGMYSVEIISEGKSLGFQKLSKI